MCNTSVKTLRNLNNLPGDVIVPGMTLVIPKIDESKVEEQKKKQNKFSLGLLNPFKQKSKKNERSTSA
jgi:LysM repeat protein|tara:strand:- start:72 stop:275 length:204 start_codon:yes stop_codon:yes gene_type:complete